MENPHLVFFTIRVLFYSLKEQSGSQNSTKIQMLDTIVIENNSSENYLFIFRKPSFYNKNMFTICPLCTQKHKIILKLECSVSTELPSFSKLKFLFNIDMSSSKRELLFIFKKKMYEFWIAHNLHDEVLLRTFFNKYSFFYHAQYTIYLYIHPFQGGLLLVHLVFSNLYNSSLMLTILYCLVNQTTNTMLSGEERSGSGPPFLQICFVNASCNSTIRNEVRISLNHLL